MEEFIDNIKMLVNTLGHKLFDEKRELKSQQKLDSFYIKAARGAEGQGIPTSEGFVVFKGSKAASETVKSFPINFAKIRNKLIDENILVHKGEYYEFTEDYLFSSPSTAAAIVMGRNANGLMEWTQKSGKTLKHFESIDNNKEKI
jgi:hypothetical protein